MISEAALWASLPTPAVLVDRNDMIIDVNGVAEMMKTPAALSSSFLLMISLSPSLCIRDFHP